MCSAATFESLCKKWLGKLSKQIMSVVIGLDVGDKRVGVAISDSSQLLASPHSILDRAQNRAEKAILELIETHHCQELVVGLPLGADNSENEQCQKVKNFCRRLQKRVSIELYYIDEFGSSMEAEERLRDNRRPRRHNGKKEEIDAAAAAIILQAFLDERRAKNV
jgi:putative Holliday junction resolvase